MTLPPELRRACRQRQLLVLWAALPFTLAAEPPPNRALALNRVQSCLAGLAGPPPDLVRLPPLPILSLDPTPRLEQHFQAAGLALQPVHSRREVPVRDGHSLLKVGGDLAARRGVILSRAEIRELHRDPDKAHLLAEARRRLDGRGVLLILGADPRHEDWQTWWSILSPALGRPAVFAVGEPASGWPAGVTRLESDLKTLSTALRTIAPEPEPAEPAPAPETAYVINVYGPVQGLTIGNGTRVEQRFEAPVQTIQGDWDTLIAQVLSRLDRLSDQLDREIASLKQSQASLYRQVAEADRAGLARVLEAVQQGRLAQGEMLAALTDLRQAMKVVLNRGAPMDPELRAAMQDLIEAVESSLSLDQKLELALPLVPLLLNYKIELTAGSELDLHDLWDELQRRWQQLIGAAKGSKEG
jgi:hypothetical protein